MLAIGMQVGRYVEVVVRLCCALCSEGKKS